MPWAPVHVSGLFHQPTGCLCPHFILPLPLPAAGQDAGPEHAADGRARRCRVLRAQAAGLFQDGQGGAAVRQGGCPHAAGPKGAAPLELGCGGGVSGLDDEAHTHTHTTRTPLPCGPIRATSRSSCGRSSRRRGSRTSSPGDGLRPPESIFPADTGGPAPPPWTLDQLLPGRRRRSFHGPGTWPGPGRTTPPQMRWAPTAFSAGECMQMGLACRVLLTRCRMAGPFITQRHGGQPMQLHKACSGAFGGFVPGWLTMRPPAGWVGRGRAHCSLSPIGSVATRIWPMHGTPAAACTCATLRGMLRVRSLSNDAGGLSHGLIPVRRCASTNCAAARGPVSDGMHMGSGM